MYIDKYISHGFFSPEFVRFHFSEFCQNCYIFSTVLLNWLLVYQSHDKIPWLTVMLVTMLCWWIMIVTVLKCWRQNHYVGDFFNFGHQHLKLITNTICLQHPSPTSMSSRVWIFYLLGWYWKNDIFRIFINVNQPNRMSCGIRSSVLSIMSTVNYKILSDKVID